MHPVQRLDSHETQQKEKMTRAQRSKRRAGEYGEKHKNYHSLENQLPTSKPSSQKTIVKKHDDNDSPRVIEAFIISRRGTQEMDLLHRLGTAAIIIIIVVVVVVAVVGGLITLVG